jgi:hypothetical protein
MLKLLYAGALTAGSAQFQVPSGKYGSFYAVFTGTNGAGNTLTLLNLGNVQYNVGGDDKVNCDIEFLNQVNNLYHGAPSFASAIGGAFTASIDIPCNWWYDQDNVYDIKSINDSMFTFLFPALPALATGTLEVYGVPKSGEQNYFHKILTYNIISAGASILPVVIPVSNIINIYQKNPTALLTRIQTVKDGIEIDNATAISLLSYSNLIHELETASTLLDIEFSLSKKMIEAVSSGLKMQLTFSGAGTLSQYYSSIQVIGK